MDAGNDGNNDEDLDITSNEAPTTLKTTRKGSKSARGRTSVTRTCRSCDESNISPSPLPMPPHLKQLQPMPAPPTQQQGASLPRCSSGPLEIRMTSTPLTSKDVINISQGLDVLGRVMMKMQATTERLVKRCEASEGHLATIVGLLSQEAGMGNSKTKRGVEEDDDIDTDAGDERRLSLDDTEMHQDNGEQSATAINKIGEEGEARGGQEQGANQEKEGGDDANTQRTIEEAVGESKVGVNQTANTHTSNSQAERPIALE
ncbi:hypothetical protein KEM55_004631 [Ascosphaera atra]|nr:hypothetical protein KEM55_004631 [Ascosphaera atra]